MSDDCGNNSFGYGMKSVASNYLKYRPMWPPKLFEMILSYLDDKGSEAGDVRRRRAAAVDVGCGSGQSTRQLCEHFNAVTGIDTSEAQLVEARRFCSDLRNLQFKLLAAEKLGSGFDEGSVDLITAGAAVHWFHLKTFFAEVRRVLKPNGAFAAFGWQIPTLDNEEANDIFHHQVFRGIFERHWESGAYHVFSFYEEPFSTLEMYLEDTVRDDSLKIEYNFSINEIFGFIKSFPQYHYYKASHPQHPDDVDDAIDRLTRIYEAASKEEKVAKGFSQVTLILGRKPSNAA